MTNTTQGKSISYLSLNRKLREAARKPLSMASEEDLKNLLVANAGDYGKIPQPVLPIFKAIVGAAVTERLAKIEREKKNENIPKRRERPAAVDSDSDGNS